MTEKASATGTEYTTRYEYDAFGNLAKVIDPSGGETTMRYDEANRLLERRLPNGVTTTYTYHQTLDWIMSMTHTNAQGEVLASVTYERTGIGQPSKITREDGSFVTLKYDAALRVTEESYYNPDGTLQETITSTYDSAGKRTSRTDRFGTDVYAYKPGYQLGSISGTDGNEDYDFDANGRLTLIERGGETSDLQPDTQDRLAQVAIEGVSDRTIRYQYDGSGNRIRAIGGSQERQFLVAPAMGGGLQSTDLIADGNGNLLSNYVYAGGHTPFMRIDSNGNPVYYLTDAMGSVIGLADGTGAEAGDFRYDSFGNLRGLSGTPTLIAPMGGDFRFQGQWLEAETGLYHFRARDYDAHTGRFISRDPIDIVETEPESFNPYQFVYNNPLVYSDPTGMFTMIEINASIETQKILNGIQAQIVNQARQYFIDQAKGVAGNLI
jgi:RHS repeat-associated protein